MEKIIKWWNERGYKTQKNLIDKIRDIINSSQDDQIIQNEIDKELIVWVLSHHHEYSQKTNDSEKFEIQVRRSKVNPGNKELWLLFADGSFVDISWRNAMSPTGGPTIKDNLRSAAVQAIEQQINNFKDSNNDFNCSLCSEIIEEKIEACHYEPRLDQLLTNFFGDEKAMSEIVITDGPYAYRYFSDTTLRDSWVDFHKKNAILRPAHASCIRKRKKT